MDFWTFVMAAYCLSAIMAITLTYQEQKRRGQSSPVYSLIGYLLCTVWPVVATVMVVFYKAGNSRPLVGRAD
ncbi:hypothetical protein [Pacificoceanicola onchidii]|uniref:hypothetical protein n=1 Tax=Pacificoceanicola onchidii TaxID=2562685 RepID=UPI0010A5FDB3|nr:hypothetical protein [Pacificoceanicola onchidii]